MYKSSINSNKSSINHSQTTDNLLIKRFAPASRANEKTLNKR